LSEPSRQVRRQLARDGDRPRDASLRRPLDGGQRAHLEPQLPHLDAALSESRAHFVGQKRELVCPHTGRNAQQQHAARERDRLGLVGDSAAHGLAP